jgi:hypothetical protein
MGTFRVDSIKKLTSNGRWSSHISLDMVVEKLEGWKKTLSLDLCPDFQRGHVWTEQQQINFVEFVLRGGHTGPILFNHPGWSSNFKGDFVCVDGLQRLTALTKFLRNELPVFGGHLLSDFDGGDVLIRGIDIVFQVNNLKTKKEVLTWYLELNSGGTPHSEEELNRVGQILSDME